MKIVAGKYGGRRLIVPKNRDIRPTSDKVRGAIFNMLASRGAIEGAHVLDAFCGTGALGLEALSRGAKSCLFVDKSRTSLALSRENAGILGAEDFCTYVFGDVQKAIKKLRKSESGHENNKNGSLDPKLVVGDKNIHNNENRAYSLIFLDPPYNKDLIVSTLWVLKGVGGLYDNAWIVCESERGLSYDDIDGFRVDITKEYGSTKVVLLQYDNAYAK